jgi:hypothetical protein
MRELQPLKMFVYIGRLWFRNLAFNGYNSMLVSILCYFLSPFSKSYVNLKTFIEIVPTRCSAQVLFMQWEVPRLYFYKTPNDN